MVIGRLPLFLIHCNSLGCGLTLVYQSVEIRKRHKVVFQNPAISSCQSLFSIPFVLGNFGCLIF